MLRVDNVQLQSNYEEAQRVAEELKGVISEREEEIASLREGLTSALQPATEAKEEAEEPKVENCPASDIPPTDSQEVESALQQAAEEIESLQAANSQLQSNYEDAQRVAEELKGVISEREEEIASLREGLTSALQPATEAKEEAEEPKVQNCPASDIPPTDSQEVESALQQAAEEIEEAQRESEELKGVISEREQEVAYYREQLSVTTDQNELFMETYNHLLSDFKQATGALDEEREKVTSLSTEVEELKAENLHLKNRIQTTEVEDNQQQVEPVRHEPISVVNDELKTEAILTTSSLSGGGVEGDKMADNDVQSPLWSHLINLTKLTAAQDDLFTQFVTIRDEDDVDDHQDETIQNLKADVHKLEARCRDLNNEVEKYKKISRNDKQELETLTSDLYKARCACEVALSVNDENTMAMMKKDQQVMELKSSLRILRQFDPQAIQAINSDDDLIETFSEPPAISINTEDPLPESSEARLPIPSLVNSPTMILGKSTDCSIAETEPLDYLGQSGSPKDELIRQLQAELASKNRQIATLGLTSPPNESDAPLCEKLSEEVGMLKTKLADYNNMKEKLRQEEELLREKEDTIHRLEMIDEKIQGNIVFTCSASVSEDEDDGFIDFDPSLTTRFTTTHLSSSTMNPMCHPRSSTQLVANTRQLHEVMQQGLFIATSHSAIWTKVLTDMHAMRTKLHDIEELYNETATHSQTSEASLLRQEIVTAQAAVEEAREIFLENDNLKEQVLALRAENEQLNDKLKLSAKLQQVRDQASDNEAQSLRHENKHLQELLKRETLQLEISHTNEPEDSILREKNKELEGTVNELKERLEDTTELQDQIQRLQDTIAGSHKEDDDVVEHLRSENRCLLDTVVNLQKEVSQQLEDSNAASSLEKALEESCEEVERLQQQNRELQQVVDRLQSENNGSSKDGEHQTEEESIASLIQQNKELISEIAILKNQQSKQPEALTKLSDNDARLRRLEQEAAALYEPLQRDNEHLTNQLNSLRAESQENEDEQTQLLSRLEKVNLELQQSEDKNTNLIREMEAIKSDQTLRIEELNEAKGENEKLLQTLCHFEEDVESLNEVLRRNEKQLEGLNGTIHNLTQELACVKAECTEITAERDALATEKGHFEKVTAELAFTQGEQGRLLEKIRNSDARIDDFNANIQNLTQQLVAAKTECTKATTEKDISNKKCQHLEKVTTEQAAAIKSTNEQLLESWKKLRESQLLVETTQNDCNTLRDTVTAITTKMQVSAIDAADSHSKSQSTIMVLKEELQQVTDSNTSLKQSLLTCEKEHHIRVQELNDQLQEANRSLKQLEDSHKMREASLNEDIVDLNNQLRQATDVNIPLLKKELNQTNDVQNELSSLRESLEKENDGLRQQLECLKEEAFQNTSSLERENIALRSALKSERKANDTFQESENSSFAESLSEQGNKTTNQLGDTKTNRRLFNFDEDNHNNTVDSKDMLKEENSKLKLQMRTVQQECHDKLLGSSAVIAGLRNELGKLQRRGSIDSSGSLQSMIKSLKSRNAQLEADCSRYSARLSETLNTMSSPSVTPSSTSRSLPPTPERFKSTRKNRALFSDDCTLTPPKEDIDFLKEKVHRVSHENESLRQEVDSVRNQLLQQRSTTEKLDMESDLTKQELLYYKIQIDGIRNGTIESEAGLTKDEVKCREKIAACEVASRRELIYRIKIGALERRITRDEERAVAVESRLTSTTTKSQQIQAIFKNINGE
eukprot:TRINITY_DN1568_c0_g1_i1.p1 TRINITY_DN1568_c0_g1~~TRINITY_DN1568_c0_g1_i1.p1  ORF type:complete len:1728 (+),score=539.06 TRINITY_DN1568_c0_g1_i1:3120-8303(+)